MADIHNILLRLVSAWVYMVQCPESGPCIMPCHGPCVRGFWREYCAWLYAADMGPWCLAQLSSAEENQTEAAGPTRRWSLVSVCRNSVAAVRRQLHNIRPAVDSCHKEKIASSRDDWLAPGGREAWPGSELRIMAPNLRLRSGNLRGIVGAEEGLPPPPSSHPQSADQTAQVRSGAGNGQQMVWHNQTRIRDVEIKVFSDWFQWLERWIVWTSWQGWKPVVRPRSYQPMAGFTGILERKLTKNTHHTLKLTHFDSC